MKTINDYAELVKAEHALNKTIAPVEDGANIVGSYTSGKQFIRGGVLYTALTTIAANTAWSSLTLDTDYEVADDLSTQLASVNSALSNEVVTRAKLGGHNLLPNNATSNSHFTVNSDGSITCNITHNAWTQINLVSSLSLKAGDYILSTTNSLNSTEFLSIRNADTSEAIASVTNGNVKEFTLAQDTNTEVYLGIQAGTHNFTIYPMLRLSTDSDSTYQPYSMSNQEITPYVQAISNPNLLDNPWFTVNQRGITNDWTTQFNYGPDRWRKQLATTTYTLDANGITSNDNRVGIFQIFTYDMINDLFGKTLTASMLVDGTIISGSAVIPLSWKTDGQNHILTFWQSDDTYSYLRLEFTASSSRVNFVANKKDMTSALRALKLEIGSVSTLAMDTAPNYQQELAKCQRYFVRLEGNIGTGYFKNTTECSCLCPIPVPMRATPSLTMNGSIGVGTEDGLFGTLTGITSWAEKPVSMIGLTGVGVTTTAGYFCRLFANAGASLDVSADL